MAEKKNEVNTANAGMNLERIPSQIPKGQVSYALNATVESSGPTGIVYQNEQGNELCVEFPEGYKLIGKHYIVEKTKHIFFLVNPDTGDSEIGYMDNNDCVYRKLINAKCLNFKINYPIHKIVHKITNCSVEIYWTDSLNNRRYIDLDNLPYKTEKGVNDCDDIVTDEIDCNKLNVQPNFSIPNLKVVDIVSGGNLQAGTVQFAIQYSDAAGNGYSSYYSVTNPVPISNNKIVTPNYDYPVGKSVVIDIANIDTTGYFEYFNLAVIKTVNAISSVELVGTYFIDNSNKQITYSGQNQTQIRLSIDDIFEKFPQYEKAEDVASVQDIIIWKGLTSIDRINYQWIANRIKLYWQTWRIPINESYIDEINATNLRGYMRDEIYPFEIVFFRNSKQTDGFHIPGREMNYNEFTHPDISENHADFIGEPFDTINRTSPYWAIYNTASVLGTDPAYSSNSDYKGPYQWGEFAYWESTETYPCNEDIWGELANKPIRHHKFPDVLVSPIFENPTITIEGDKYTNLAMQRNAIFPIGVKLDISEIRSLIQQSPLTSQQKSEITGFKIVRGNRDVNKSVIAKGILRNVGKYRRGEEDSSENYSTTTTTTSIPATTTTTTTV